MKIDYYLEQIRKEEQRNLQFLHLTANENQLSNTARTFLNAKFNERYYMGAGDKNQVVNLGHFTVLGFKGVDAIVEKAEQATRQMLSAAEVNLNPISGVHAMMCAILSTTEPGDVVMSVSLEAGGHFTTKRIIERTGRKHIFADYDFSNLKFDVKKIAKKFKQEKVKALYLDVSYYLNKVNLSEIRAAIGEKPIIIYDASHTIGLMMGQQFQSPLKEGANVLCANTHKTLPGPHRGMIAFRDKDLSIKANAIINHGLLSTQHISHLIALSITILEMKKYGRDYAKQIISNSNAIGEAFAKLGYEVKKSNTGRYSENHQCHVFIDKFGDPNNLYKNLIQNNISTNFEGLEFGGGRWFMRLGTAEVTRRGMKEKEMSLIAKLIDKALNGKNIKDEILSLNGKFTKIFYSFDQRSLAEKILGSIF